MCCFSSSRWHTSGALVTGVQTWALPIYAISESRGDIPVGFLHLAGLYDERTSVPTFANQIARIYERDFQSHLYSGDTDAGQAMVHREDMIDAFVRTIDRRDQLPDETVILIGESDAIGYDDLQDRLGSRSEEHTYELQSLMRISYAVFCLKKK